MKCPKCGYLGFETTDRCRNCGYDFSLSQHTSPAPELPLQPTTDAGAPLADLELTTRLTPRSPDRTPALDLDKLIGVQTVVAAPAPRAVEAPPAAVAAHARTAAVSPPETPDEIKEEAPVGGLPLFKPGKTDDDTVPVTAPRRAGAPLSVRRSTPDVPRGRSTRPQRPAQKTPETPPALQLEPTGDPVVEPRLRSARTSDSARPSVPEPASVAGRLFAGLIDLLLLAAVNAAVLYFTLAIAGLTVDEVRLLPVMPLAAFLLLLNGGYLIAFTAAGGQTIGKMAAGIRVMNDDFQRVDFTGAVIRAVGCVLSLLTAGAGFLPVFLSADGRALQDRMAGTRVVRAR